MELGVKKMKKGSWSKEEDKILFDWVAAYGPQKWSCLRSKGLLMRTGNACRLRWVNKLQPSLKKDCEFSPKEADVIVELQAIFGNKWARIAEYLPGRTDNDVKNFWRMRRQRLAQSSLLSIPRSETGSELVVPTIEMHFCQISTDDHQQENLNQPYIHQSLEATSATPVLTRPANNPCNSKAALPSAPSDDVIPHQQCLSDSPATPVPTLFTGYYPINTKREPSSVPGLKIGRRFSLEEADMLLDLQEIFGNNWAYIAQFFPRHNEDDVKKFWSIQKKRLARSALLPTPKSETGMYGPGLVVPRNEIHSYEKRWYEDNAERLDAIRDLQKLPHLAHFKAWRQQDEQTNPRISTPERPQKCMHQSRNISPRTLHHLQNRSMVLFKAWKDDTPSNTDLLHQAEKKTSPVVSVCTIDTKSKPSYVPLDGIMPYQPTLNSKPVTPVLSVPTLDISHSYQQTPPHQITSFSGRMRRKYPRQLQMQPGMAMNGMHHYKHVDPTQQSGKPERERSLGAENNGARTGDASIAEKA